MPPDGGRNAEDGIPYITVAFVTDIRRKIWKN